LDLLTLVTPHIAGYSLAGKARGNQMLYDPFCQTFALAAHKQFETQLPVCEQFFQNQDLKMVRNQYLTQIYDISCDDPSLRTCVKDVRVDQQAFAQLRICYPLRCEWAVQGRQ